MQAVPELNTEPQLLGEIRGIAHRIRSLRTRDARINTGEIKLLEVQSRATWEQLRRLRAGPVDVDRTPDRRSLNR